MQNMNMMGFNANGMMNAAGGMHNGFQVMPNPFTMGMHNPGPNRRGGRGFNGVRSGPYDRRGGGGGMQRGYSSSSGGGPPMMGFIAQGGGGGGGKWGDGAGGVAIVPKEAVQGRSIKSYEDLDAAPAGGGGAGQGSGAQGAGGSGGAELDY